MYVYNYFKAEEEEACLHRLIPTDWLTDALFVSNTSRSKVISTASDRDEMGHTAARVGGQNGLCIFIIGIY